MSRIGNRVLTIPADVKLIVNSDNVIIAGKNNELTVAYPSQLIQVKVEDNKVVVLRVNDEKQTKMFHGTVNANIANALYGVTVGWKKNWILKG